MSHPGKLKFRKNFWMTFPGFDNKGQEILRLGINRRSKVSGVGTLDSESY